MGKYLLTRVQKTFLWIGCTWIGVYVAYKYWKKRKVKAIDESFKKMLEVRNLMLIRDYFKDLDLNAI